MKLPSFPVIKENEDKKIEGMSVTVVFWMKLNSQPTSTSYIFRYSNIDVKLLIHETKVTYSLVEF